MLILSLTLRKVVLLVVRCLVLIVFAILCIPEKLPKYLVFLACSIYCSNTYCILEPAGVQANDFVPQSVQIVSAFLLLMCESFGSFWLHHLMWKIKKTSPEQLITLPPLRKFV